MLRVRSLMTADVTSVSPEATIREAMETLTRERISGAPVVSGRKVVGVVSMTDLVAFMAAASDGIAGYSGLADELVSDAPPSAAELEELDVSDADFFTEFWSGEADDVTDQIAAFEASHLSQLEQHVVSEVMTASLVTLPSDTPVTVAANVLRKERVHRVLVVDNGELVGILSSLDIARAVADGRLTTRTYVFNRDRDFEGVR